MAKVSLFFHLLNYWVALGHIGKQLETQEGKEL